MIKLFVFVIGFVSSTVLLEVELWAATVRSQLTSITEIIQELPGDIADKKLLLERNQVIADRFGCSAYPLCPMIPRGLELSELRRKVTSPETEADWHTFGESQKSLFCTILSQMIEKSSARLLKKVKFLELQESLLTLYSQIDLSSIPIPDPIIALLSAAEEYGRFVRIRTLLTQQLRDFHNGHLSPAEDVGLPSWPLANSEPILRELITAVFAEGSGEEKVDLFMRKLCAASTNRFDIYIMAENILKEFDREILTLNTKIYNLEKALI